MSGCGAAVALDVEHGQVFEVDEPVDVDIADSGELDEHSGGVDILAEEVGAALRGAEGCGELGVFRVSEGEDGGGGR